MIACTINGVSLNLHTEKSLFSPNGIDKGTRAMLSNADFSVPKAFIEEGYRHLKYGGCMVMFTKRYQWYKNKLKSVFGGVKVIEENGYFVFISQKKAARRAMGSERPELSKKLRRKYR